MLEGYIGEDKNSKAIILSIFDNNFIMMTRYFIEHKKYSEREAMDQALIQAYYRFVNMLSMVNWSKDSKLEFENKFNEYGKFLSQEYTEGSGNIFYRLKEHCIDCKIMQ